ncbi:MAG: sulfatase-like hydrolase/transferase [Verrucomicrobiota bacterium]
MKSVFFLTFLFALSVAVASDKPNILVIIVDDLGYGDLSSYGAEDLKSPRIDEMMASGMRFDHFYANCPVCSPTRAALLTGRYQELVGVPGVVRTHADNNWGYLAQDALLLPQILKPAGYHSACIGKWHRGLMEENQPTRRGFDFFHGFLGDMMDDYYDHLRHGNHYMRRNEVPVHPEGHATEVFSQWAIEYINERAKTEEPWFLYLAYNAPHTPIQPPEDWFEKVKAREPGITDKRAKLVALIEHMDEGIGQVMDGLTESGEAENTLVFFVSDNGGQLNVGANCGNLRGGKQDMYEGGIRVPACAVWPGVIEAGSQSDFVGMTMDIFTTAAEAAGVDVNHAMEGISMMELLKTGKEEPILRDLFWTRREGNARFQGESTWAMRRGSWKVLKNNPMQPWEMYNLEADPLETTDLAQKNKGKFNELMAAMRVQIQRGGAVPWQKSIAP